MVKPRIKEIAASLGFLPVEFPEIAISAISKNRMAEAKEIAGPSGIFFHMGLV